MKTVCWLSNPARYCLAVLAMSLSVPSCDSDSEGVPQNDIAIKSISPESPATLDFYETSQNDRVVIEYDYNISHPDGARIWIQPYKDGAIVSDYLYSSSGVFKGTGTRNVLVSAGDADGEVHVDALRISIVSPDHSIQLAERFIDVDYTFN